MIIRHKHIDSNGQLRLSFLNLDYLKYAELRPKLIPQTVKEGDTPLPPVEKDVLMLYFNVQIDVTVEKKIPKRDKRGNVIRNAAGEEVYSVKYVEERRDLIIEVEDQDTIDKFLELHP